MAVLGTITASGSNSPFSVGAQVYCMWRLMQIRLRDDVNSPRKKRQTQKLHGPLVRPISPAIITVIFQVIVLFWSEIRFRNSLMSETGFYCNVQKNLCNKTTRLMCTNNMQNSLTVCWLHKM